MEKDSTKYLAWSAFLFLILIMGWAHIYAWKKADRHIYSLAATLEANIVAVQAQTAGKVSAVYIKPHSLVKRGDLLFQIDPGSTVSDVTKAQQNLKRIKEEVKRQQNEIIAAERRVNERQHQISEASKQALLNSQDKNDSAITEPQGDLNQALNQLNLALQKYGKPGAAQEKIDAAQAEVDRAQNKLQMTKIYAPVDGFVNELDVNLGSQVISQQPLLKIVQDNSWILNAYFKPRDIARIYPQQACMIKFDSSTQPLEGVVQKVQPQKVKIKLLNANNLPLKVSDDALVSIELKNPA